MRANQTLRLQGYFTCEQAAAKLKMKPDTLRRYVHRGLIHSKPLGNMRLIPVGEIEKFSINRRPPGRPPKSA